MFGVLKFAAVEVIDGSDAPHFMVEKVIIALLKTQASSIYL